MENETSITESHYGIKLIPRFTEFSSLYIVPICILCGASLDGSTLEKHLKKNPICKFDHEHSGTKGVKYIEVFMVRVEC